MKRNYIAPATEQVAVKIEQHLLDLSFDDTVVDPGTALSKRIHLILMTMRLMMP